MSTIYPIAQTLYVNKQSESASQQYSHNRSENEIKAVAKSAALEGDIIKIGDASSFIEAQDMFERANQFNKISNNAQNGIQAYTSQDIETRRETVRELMGVDLYA